MKPQARDVDDLRALPESLEQGFANPRFDCTATTGICRQ